MDRQQLETWLCDGVADPSPATIAELVGIPYAEIGDSTLLRVADRLLALRFTVAVLRDVFTDDRGVGLWLRASRPELDGPSALDRLFAGDTAAVEALAVREWNAAASAPDDDAPPPAPDYRQSVGRSSAIRDVTSAASDAWPADPTFSTVWAV